MITQKELKELLHYDPETGIFTWLVTPYKYGRVKIGDSAGSNDAYGYRRIKIKRRSYKSHRLAWLYVYGHFPPNALDHINVLKDDNRISNLRLATNSENQMNRGKPSNNTSGFKGVSWHKRRKKWDAYGQLNGKNKHLGAFDTAEAASVAYKSFAEQQHGQFYRV